MISKGNRRDPSKYCRFHKDHGHDTDECWQLKEEIEQLIGRGYLKKYIRTDGRKQERRVNSPRGRSPRRSQPPPARNKTPQPPSTQPEAPRSQPRGVIGTIMGGHAAGGTSSAARKAYARRINAVHTTSKKTRTENEISFSDADLDNLILPHDDALVVLKKHSMKLNPTKCTFGVSSGKILGFMVSQRGIEANPEKIKAVMELTAPKTIREVQRLTGMIAALGRFISKSTERCLPFFSAVKGLKTAPWTEECQTAFEELKKYLSSPPLLTKPEPGEELFLYLSVSSTALASVLVREEHRQQKPIYYVSKYAPRPAIKAQVLADFVAECTIPQQFVDSEAVQLPVAEKAAPKECIAEGTETEIIHPPAERGSTTSALIWEVHVDGSSNKSGCGAGLVLTGPDDFTADYALRFGFRASNNEIQGVYEARDERMTKYLAKVHQLASKFKSFEVIRVPRTENAKADVLSKLAASGYTTLGSIHIEFLSRSSIESKAAETMQVENEPCWMDEIISYLRDGKLPEDKKEARKVIQRAARFSLSSDILYKRSYTLPYLKCLRPGIKKRLDEKAGRWADELYHALWAYRTTPRTPTGESPFNLSFGTEAVIPVDVGTSSPRVTSFNEQLNSDGLRANLDLLEEIREESRIRVAAYKQRVSNYHDSKVRPREFRTGDLVLRRAAVSQPLKVGKLSPTWEGPYRVKEVIRPGSYKLETLEERLLPHVWNSKNLRKYYQ
ncbi:uncharacterized protein LOC143888001 [Tasmannia lanceolata]|uniref:uncharacterized protein LOC143888001 n=1 Tax=Tasmannia lanceolata TaxID=3420 RepID=UPI00406451A6